MFKKIVLVGGITDAGAHSARGPQGSRAPRPRPAQSHPRAVGDAERNEIHHPRGDPRRGDRRFADLHQREGRRWGHRK